MVTVIIRPIFGINRHSVERAREELVRALGFRGNVISAEVNGRNVIARCEIDQQWDLPIQYRVKNLKDSIHSEVRGTFRVLSVFEDRHDQAGA